MSVSPQFGNNHRSIFQDNLIKHKKILMLSWMILLYIQQQMNTWTSYGSFQGTTKYGLKDITTQMSNL